MVRAIKFGEIEGIKEGHSFQGRKDMMPTCFHRNHGTGIDGNSKDGNFILLKVATENKAT